MKTATVIIKREAGTETFMGLVIAEGTTHTKIGVIKDNASRHCIDRVGEWIANDSPKTKVTIHN